MLDPNQLVQLILKDPITSAPLTLDKFPMWLKSSCKLFRFGKIGEKDVFFIVPNNNLEFDQIINIQQQVQKRLDCVAILVADDLPPSYRSTFVRMGIPYLVKSHSLFAPELGVKISDVNVKSKAPPAEIDVEISPLELKLISGFLCKQRTFLLGWMNLTRLNEFLVTEFYTHSLSKISDSINKLIQRQMLEVKGRGPHREFRFTERENVWKGLREADVTKFFRRFVSEVGHKSPTDILAGETALGYYSSLSQPDYYHIALTSSQMMEYGFDKKSLKSGSLSQPKFLIDVFKEPPSLFYKEVRGHKCVNPIELYLSLKNTNDERVQTALWEMLKLQTGLEI